MTQTLDPSAARTDRNARTERPDHTVNTGAEEFRPGVAERALAAGARSIGWIPAPVRSLLSKRNRDGDRLDGDVALSLLSLKLVGGEDISAQTPESARHNVDRQAYLAGSGGPAVQQVGAVEHRMIAGVRTRIYTPVDPTGPADPAAPAPVLIYFHGGGFVTGSLDSHDSTCRYFCARGRIRVISVDYRMAPEHPFPAPLEDAVSVVSAALAGEIPEVDPAGVAIAGDSAGGHLSAITCLRLRQLGLPQPALQMLFVPLTDQRPVDVVKEAFPSRREFAEGPYLTEEHFRWYDDAYLGHLADGEREDELVSPLLASSLDGLAPAYVAVAGHDPLRDEGEAYAARLAEAGVPTTVRRHGGLVHPFVNSSVIWSGSADALNEAVGALRQSLSA